MNPPKFYLKLKGLAKQNVGWSLRPKTFKNNMETQNLDLKQIQEKVRITTGL